MQTLIKRSALTVLSIVLLLNWRAPAIAAEASLTWDANTESNLAGYKVYYGTSSGNYGPPIDVGNQTSFIVTGLNGSIYFFTVTAYNDSGDESGYSTEVSKSFDDVTAPTLSSIAAGSITSSSATITWNTNEAATSQVEYGITTAYGSTSALNSTLVTGHSRVLSNLNPSTTYHYRVISRDAGGNTGTSGDRAFTTSAAPDTTPPAISGISTSNITTTAATISWTTNEVSDTQIQYGTTASYGSSTTLNTTLTTSHSQQLTGLLPSTLYHYRVLSRDSAGNLATSGDRILTTATPPDTTGPTLSNIAASNITSTSAVITWSTNETATSQVEYGTTLSYGSSSALGTTPVTSHGRTLSNLNPSTTYNYRVISRDAAGNTATSGNNLFTTAAAPFPSDTTGPVLSAIDTRDMTVEGVTITWGTDEPATSEVEYGLTAGYGSSTGVNATLENNHRQVLSGLQPNTVYHYRVKSSDALGNLSISADHTFTTHPLIDSVPPADVENFTAVPGTQMVTLSWVNPSDSDFVGVRIVYRIDRFPSDLDDGEILGDFSGRTNERISVIHAGLQENVTYYYSASSYDNDGNYQHTAHASATPSGLSRTGISNGGSSGGENASGGGCALIVTKSGFPIGPEDAADLVGMMGVIMLALLRKLRRSITTDISPAIPVPRCLPDRSLLACGIRRLRGSPD